MLDVTATSGPIAPDSVDALADRAAVCEVPRDYALGIDLRDTAMVASLFAPGAIIRGPIGESPFEECVSQLHAGVAPCPATVHNITNQYAAVNGDGAAVWSYAVALHLEEPGNGRDDMEMGVHYRDQLARTPGGGTGRGGRPVLADTERVPVRHADRRSASESMPFLGHVQHRHVRPVNATRGDGRARLTDPVGRIGTPVEIVGTALFVASDASRYMTGALVALDGGAG